MNGGGDVLARGATSAMFGPPSVPKNVVTRIRTPRKKKVLFAECKDCGFKAYSAQEFCEHCHECVVKPTRRAKR
jgi:uncharacterized OB-fold protein